MVKMSTKDFINLLENLKDDVELSVSVDVRPTDIKTHGCTAVYSNTAGIDDTTTSGITGDMIIKRYETEIEEKIAKAFKDQSFIVGIDDSRTPMFESRYYCSNTDSYIVFRHRFGIPPSTFTIEDRGITKNYSEYSTKEVYENKTFETYRPIILVKQF